MVGRVDANLQGDEPSRNLARCTSVWTFTRRAIEIATADAGRAGELAPSSIPKRSGERIKTDRRDAMLLARLSRSGDLTEVRLPGAADEAVRDLVRGREDATHEQRNARHRLKALLLLRNSNCVADGCFAYSDMALPGLGLTQLSCHSWLLNRQRSTDMTSSSMTSEHVLGKTIRMTWTAGPTKGASHEHVFHEDGTVEWRSVDEAKKSAPKVAKPDRPQYLARDIAPQSVLISYLSSSGYTLTVALNFRNQTTLGVVSSEKTWAAVEGTFAVVHEPAVSIGDA